MNLLTNGPFWLFIFSFLGAVFTWFAADHFREQILADSHRLVREVALRYLQVIVGLFVLFVLVMAVSIGSMVTRFIAPTDNLLETPVDDMITQELIVQDTPTMEVSLTPELVPTILIAFPSQTAVPSEGDPDLQSVETVIVVNTNGVGVNAREIPGLGGAVLDVVPENTRLTLLGGVESADGYMWYQVILPSGQEGWIADLFLAFSGE